MIRIKLVDGSSVDTHLHTLKEVIEAKTSGRDITVGGDTDTWHGPEDQLPEDTRDRRGVPVPDLDLRGTSLERTIAASQIAGVSEVAA